MKWHLPSSNAAEHRGKTDKARIAEHKATWDYAKNLPIRLTVEKNFMLQECDIHFEILQEYSEGGRGGRVHLGNVKLNLAEYTQFPDPQESDAQDENEDGCITRRYLLQDSKVNCTLKVGIKMKQTEGETNFIAPPLKSAMIFGGIAGVISTEEGDGGDMPTLSSKTREISEAQDLYRRTLAASWACQNGELPPDKLIEDLFAGGDGGQMQPPAKPAFKHLQPSPHLREESLGSSSSDAESKRTVTPQHLSPDMAWHGNHNHSRHRNISDATVTSHTSMPGGGKQEEHIHGGSKRRQHRDSPELSEFDLREDLRSWQVRVR